MTIRTVEPIRRNGFRTAVSGEAGSQGRRTGMYTFAPPSLLRIDSVHNEDGSSQNLVLFCTPTRPGWCRNIGMTARRGGDSLLLSFASSAVVSLVLSLNCAATRPCQRSHTSAADDAADQGPQGGGVRGQGGEVEAQGGFPGHAEAAVLDHPPARVALLPPGGCQVCRGPAEGAAIVLMGRWDGRREQRRPGWRRNSEVFLGRPPRAGPGVPPRTAGVPRPGARNCAPLVPHHSPQRHAPSPGRGRRRTLTRRAAPRPRAGAPHAREAVGRGVLPPRRLRQDHWDVPGVARGARRASSSH